MLIIFTMAMIALALTYMVMRSHKSDPSQLVEPRASWPTIGVQIICGNCSGDEDSPRKTYLDRFGNCAQCGGHSYILASNRAVYAQQIRTARLMDFESESGTARVLPFNVRGARAEKIAV